MPKPKPYLSEEQWKRIQPHLPNPKSRGRPFADNRRVLEGILWVLRSGARWRDLPSEYPSASTCWRRLRDWEEQGIWLELWRAFITRLDQKQKLDWDQCFMDGSFAPAKKGAPVLEKPNAARVQSGWWWSTARVYLWEASCSKPARRK
jgi:transposase